TGPTSRVHRKVDRGSQLAVPSGIMKYLESVVIFGQELVCWLLLEKDGPARGHENRARFAPIALRHRQPGRMGKRVEEIARLDCSQGQRSERHPEYDLDCLKHGNDGLGSARHEPSGEKPGVSEKSHVSATSWPFIRCSSPAVLMSADRAKVKSAGANLSGGSIASTT